MEKSFKDFIFKQKSLEDILFWVCQVFIIFSTFISTISSIIEELSPRSIQFCAFSCISFVLISILAQITKKISLCYTITCLWMCGVILPFQFFIYGGLNSSLIIYFFGAVFLCALHCNKKIRFFLIVFSILAFETTFFLSWIHPEWVTKIDEKTTFIDYCATFILLASCLAGVTSYLLSIYEESSQNKQKIFEQMKYMAERDSLTDLYNRRHFISYLTDTIWPRRKNFFIFMFDIDNFKKVNDTYGHPFGDLVLKKVAHEGKKEELSDEGEKAVRYGGEEFIQLIKAESMEEAYERAETIRRNIQAIIFPDFPEIHITISGGLVACDDPDFKSQNKALSSVDALLYKAKSQGKNQICRN